MKRVSTHNPLTADDKVNPPRPTGRVPTTDFLATLAENEKLVLSAQQGDEKAFNTLIANHRDDAYQLARSILFKPNGRLDANHSADDCLQEASLYAWRNLKFLNSPASFRPWFRSIVRSECNRLLREVSKEAKNIDIYTDIERIADLGGVWVDKYSVNQILDESPYGSPDDDSSWRGTYPYYQSFVNIVGDELADHYRWAIRQLPKQQRRVMRLKAKGYTNKEISEELEMSITGVRQNLYNARKKDEAAPRKYTKTNYKSIGFSLVMFYPEKTTIV